MSIKNQFSYQEPGKPQFNKHTPLVSEVDNGEGDVCGSRGYVGNLCTFSLCCALQLP